MTLRLYYNDAYLTEFDAMVVGADDERTRVYLDRTAFYPTSGGQQFDTGTLSGRRVLDVIDEGDRIAHVLDAPLPATASSTVRGAVHGEVDWSRRFDHMQQHTGQHLLSAILEDSYGWKTVSVHFGDATSTLDVAADTVPAAQLVAAEQRCNRVIAGNRAVGVSFEDAAGAKGLRKPTDRTGEIRVITIADLDRSACGGTHVRATGEIGALLVRRTERVKQGTRIEFVCGLRAVARARADYGVLAEVARLVSVAPDEAAVAVAARLDAVQEGDAQRRRLTHELDAYRARARYDSTAPGAGGVRYIVDVRADGALDELKGFAHAVCALPRAAFAGAIAATGQVVVGTSEDSGLEAGAVLKAALGAAGGKGGGSPRMAQGAVERGKLEAVLQAVLAAWDRGA
jgi:alanyl-tRNA synthetase